MLLDVVVGVDAPHLVRPADEVDAELRQDVGRVVQRLGEIVDAAPDEHLERARIGAPRALTIQSEPSVGRPNAGGPGAIERALLGDAAQRIGRRVVRGVGLQVGVVALRSGR